MAERAVAVDYERLDPAASNHARRIRKRWFVVAGLLVWVLAVTFIGWREVAAVLLGAHFSMVAAGAMIIFAGNWARAWKWRYALGPKHDAAAIFFLSRVAAELSPGRLGEFAPLALRRHRTYRVGAWILLDRILEAITTLALGVAALGLLGVISRPMYAVMVTLTLAATAAGVYGLSRPDLFARIAARLRVTTYLRRGVPATASFSREILAFRPKLVVAGAVTVVAKCTDLWAVALLFSAFGHAAGLPLIAAAKCAMALVSFVPIAPVAIGAPHLAQGALMNQFGGMPLDALAAVIGVETVIVSGGLWISAGIAAGMLRPST